MKVFFALVTLAMTQVSFAAGWPAPTNILQEAQVDLDKDGKLDDVYLATSSGSETEIDAELDMGLSVWVALSSTPGEYVEYKDLAINQTGAMVGSNELLVTPQGSVKVISIQDGGRDRWTDTLTIAYRDGEVVLAGYTASSYDSLVELQSGGSTCDLNLLSGKGTFKINGVSGTVELNDEDIKPALSEINLQTLQSRYDDVYCAQGDLDNGDF